MHFGTGKFGPKLQKTMYSLRNIIKWWHKWCRWCTLAQVFFSVLVYSMEEEILFQNTSKSVIFWTPCIQTSPTTAYRPPVILFWAPLTGSTQSSKNSNWCGISKLFDQSTSLRKQCEESCSKQYLVTQTTVSTRFVWTIMSTLRSSTKLKKVMQF